MEPASQQTFQIEEILTTPKHSTEKHYLIRYAQYVFWQLILKILPIYLRYTTLHTRLIKFYWKTVIMPGFATNSHNYVKDNNRNLFQFRELPKDGSSFSGFIWFITYPFNYENILLSINCLSLNLIYPGKPQQIAHVYIFWKLKWIPIHIVITIRGIFEHYYPPLL